MKQRLLGCLMLLCMLMQCICPAVADRLSDTYTDEPPAAVLAHLVSSYPDHLLEDYLVIRLSAKEQYGFALLSKGSSRTLAVYRDNGKGLTFLFRNDQAVPQGEGYAFFSRHRAGEHISQGNTSATYAKALGFDVIRIDKEHEEYWMQSVSYHWHNGRFILYAYMDRTADSQHVYVTDTGVSYYDFSCTKRLGTVKGVVQRDLRYVSFPSLPKTYVQAEKKLASVPDIPAGDLTAALIRFTGGRKYPVYSAPTSDSLRGANGKATVSTNGWIQVFGAEDGYILIQYAIDKHTMRFGYIAESALPKGTSTAPLQWRNTPVVLAQAAALTDDPLGSDKTLLMLPEGSEVTLLGTMGNWAYVESTAGIRARGFLPQESLDPGRTYNLYSHTAGKASGSLRIHADRQISVNLLVGMDPLPVRFLLTDGHGMQLGFAPATAGVPGSYQMDAALPADVTCIRFIPVYADGTQGAELFSVSW